MAGLALVLMTPPLVSGAASLTAQDYFLRFWQTDDGLPQNAVSAIVQTRDGYLWIGTYYGLARFDGKRFTVFNEQNTPQMRNSRVTALCEGPGGELWIGHETGELTRCQQNRFQAVNFPGEWPGGRVAGLVTDDAGDVWLQSSEGLVRRLRDWLLLTPRGGAAAGLVSLGRFGDGRIWVLRQGACSLLDKGALIPAEFDGGGTNNFVQGIAPSRRGGHWVALDGRLRRWSGDAWAEDFDAPWGFGTLAALVETASGAVAAASLNQGLFLFTPGAGTVHLDHSNGLPNDWVRALLEDREGDLWVGVGTSGLVMLRPSSVKTLQPPDGWGSCSVLSVAAGRDGALYAGTEGAGVYRYRDGAWTHFTGSSGLSNLFVWAVTEDAQGRLWAGTWGSGLYVMRNDCFAPAPRTEQLTIPVTALRQRADGSLWAGTASGLLHLDQTNLTWFGSQRGLVLPDVRAVTEDGEGRVWFGMAGGGLGCLEHGAVRQFRKQHGLSSDFVWSLWPDEDGTLWIGTSGGGLNRLKGGRFSAVTTSHGLPNNIICHIADDGGGNLWMSSHGGIFRVSKADLHRCADGTLASIRCVTYGRGDGLPTLECSGGLQPAGCRTADGRLWFATTRGLVVVNPEEVRTNSLPPPVHLEEFLVDGQPVREKDEGRRMKDETGRMKADGGSPASSFILHPSTLPLTVPPGQHRFEFRYTALSFVVPEKVRFRHWLKGWEQEWVDAGSERSVSYSYLPHGHYHFQVAACNNDGVWNAAGASLEFTVLPHFWQTVSFRLTVIGILLVVVGSGVWFDTRRRMRRKLERAERQRAIERERARIARDIHDDLGASLTRITMLSQSVQGRLKEEGGMQKAEGETADPQRQDSAFNLHPSSFAAASTEVGQIYQTARQLTQAMDEIVWAVNPRHDTLDSLVTYLGRFAQQFLSTAGIRCRLDLPLQLPVRALTSEVRHNVFLAFKEALHNIVKHAHASEVRLSLEVRPNGFMLVLADNGCGFRWDPLQPPPEPAPDGSRPAGGNGLVNMQKRMEEIGGCCGWDTAPGQGTRAKLVVVLEG